MSDVQPDKSVLSEDDRHIILHSLGLDNGDKDYRNGYVDVDGAPRLEALVERGFMIRGITINDGRDRVYHVTDAGRRIVGAPFGMAALIEYPANEPPRWHEALRVGSILRVDKTLTIDHSYPYFALTPGTTLRVHEVGAARADGSLWVFLLGKNGKRAHRSRGGVPAAFYLTMVEAAQLKHVGYDA